MKSETGNLRVAFFNGEDLGSGAEALITGTAEGLIARGHDARVFVMHRKTKAPYVYPLPRFIGERRVEQVFRYLSGRNDFFFPSTFFLSQRPWIRDADIWHFHNLHGHFVSIPLLARISRKRAIILSPVDQFLSTGYCTYTLGCERYRDSCGNCPQLDLPYPGLSRDTTSALLAMKKSAIERSDFNLLVHTDYLARHYASTFVGALPIERLYYGVDTKLFRPMDRDACAAKLGIAPMDRFVVALIHSDVSEKRKGLLWLLHPLQSLAEQMPGRLRVLVVGRGSERAREFGTDNLPITTLPFLSGPEELAMALSLSDVLLYPTRADNLSLTCLDALACGVPVISSRVGGQSEAIKEGVNGFLCEPDRNELFIERLAQLAGDSELHRRLSFGARRTATEHFDINTYVSNLIAYYERTLTRANKR